MQDFLKINDNDNVVVALNTIPAGEKITVSVGDGQKTVTAREEIPAGHKMAIFDIPEGGEVIKYGYRIGNAKENIAEGSWIHTHNVKTALGDLLEYTYNPTPVEEKKTEDVTFMGFNRPDGKVGVRNEIWVIPTVGCVNNVATAIAKQANAFVKGSVEEVIAFPHPYGCSQMGDDQEHTRKILADLINHPNAGGVLVLGLGCENSNIDVLKPYIGDYDENRVKFLVCQEHEDEIADSVEVIKGLIDYASKFEREPISVSKLVIGMKCGGSDGLSGITANPLVGRFSDLLISKGGTTILTEVPEMFGAEGFLMDRCINKEVFVKAEHMINGFKDYFISHNEVVYDNPSPGNKAGGITTLEDKSCGCVQKGGTAPIMDVIGYGDPVVTKGLNMLYGPGNDLVSATAMTAAGAHLILFSTGRGTPFSAPAPTLKISTNTPLAEKKGGWIDFNTGVIADGEKTIDEAAKDLLDLVIRVASGEQTKAEKHGFREISIFKDGVVL